MAHVKQQTGEVRVHGGAYCQLCMEGSTGNCARVILGLVHSHGKHFIKDGEYNLLWPTPNTVEGWLKAKLAAHPGELGWHKEVFLRA